MPSQLRQRPFYPLDDECKLVDKLRMFPAFYGHLEIVFMQKEKPYSINLHGIHAYDAEQMEWPHRCSISCDELGPMDSITIYPSNILLLDKELSVLAKCERTDNETEVYCLLRSSGFSDYEEVVVASTALLHEV